ncbi:MAG: hypothetical protein CMP66_01005 [Flavobacteriales bacterium]|nr:hypothetical protein [Flavobacteriales bacterium]
MKNKVIITLLIFSSFNLWAQDQDLDVQEVDVVEQFIPTIPPARKIVDIPKIFDTVKVQKKVYYSTLPKQYQTAYQIDTIRAAKIKGEPIPRLYQTYLKLGLGNTALPSFEVYYNSLRNKQWSYGVEFGYHNSPAKIKGYDAGFQQTNIAAYGKGVLDFGIVNANISRSGNMFSAHGMNDSLSEQQIHQYWGYSQLNVSLKSKHNSRDRLRYFTGIHLSDLNEMTENNYGFESLFKKRFGTYDYSVSFKADLYTNNTATDMLFAAEKAREGVYSLSPRFYGDLYGVKVSAGFDEVINNRMTDTVGLNFHFYPQLRVDCDIVPKIFKLYGGVRSGLQKNSYWSLSKENPFVLNALIYDGDAAELKNTSSVDLYAGLNTFFNYDIRLGAELSFANRTDMVFFARDESPNYYLNKFSVLYDNVKHFSVKANANWNPSEKKGVDLSLVYNNYNLAKLTYPSGMPSFEVNLNCFYNLGDKIIGHVDFYSSFVREAESTGQLDNEIKYIDLGNIIDFDLKVEYRYNKVLSAYLSGKRLIGGYEIWQNYPVIPRQIQLGVSCQL